MDASEYDGIAIRGRGDGNVFWVQIYSMDVLKSEFSHFYGLKTITDAWKTYYIPFKLFERPNDMHTYLNVLPHTSRISRMSVSITSTGPDDVPFSLDLKEIYFCKREEALRRRRNLLK